MILTWRCLLLCAVWLCTSPHSVWKWQRISRVNEYFVQKIAQIIFLWRCEARWRQTWLRPVHTDELWRSVDNVIKTAAAWQTDRYTERAQWSDRTASRERRLAAGTSVRLDPTDVMQRRVRPTTNRTRRPLRTRKPNSDHVTNGDISTDDDGRRRDVISSSWRHQQVAAAANRRSWLTDRWHNCNTSITAVRCSIIRSWQDRDMFVLF